VLKTDMDEPEDIGLSRSRSTSPRAALRRWRSASSHFRRFYIKTMFIPVLARVRMVENKKKTNLFDLACLRLFFVGGWVCTFDIIE
jgi:hypothetical protein